MDTQPKTTTRKTAPRRAATKAAPRPKTTAPSARPAPARRVAARRATAKQKATPAVTNEAIALRAYFIAEQRQRHGWPGTPDGDWFEAERQLRREHGLN